MFVDGALLRFQHRLVLARADTPDQQAAIGLRQQRGSLGHVAVQHLDIPTAGSLDGVKTLPGEEAQRGSEQAGGGGQGDEGGADVLWIETISAPEEYRAAAPAFRHVAGDRLGKLRVLTFTTVASGAGSLMAVFAGKGLGFDFGGWLFIHGTTELFAAALSGAAGRTMLWDEGSRLGVSGDWLIGPRIESAWASGRALAAAIVEG